MDNLQFLEPSRNTDREISLSSLLITEIENENIDEVKWLLLHKNADPNLVLPNQGFSPMHVLAGLENESFSVDIIEIALEERGGDPNIRSVDGLTPVHLAAIWGRCAVLETLLKFGGDPFLLEYKFSLNAEDLALKEHQWQTHAILATFSVFNDKHEPLDNYLHKLNSLCQPSNRNEWPDDPSKMTLLCKSAISKDFSIDFGDSISKNIQTQNFNSNMSLGGETECQRKDIYQTPQSKGSYEELENNPVDEEHVNKRDKLRRKKKLSDQFAKSFTKFKQFFGRTSIPQIGSDSGPTVDSKRKSSKTSL